jgi:hypothetical protein
MQMKDAMSTGREKSRQLHLEGVAGIIMQGDP